MPAETHLSILSLVLGGAFDRIPTSLRICFAHGGGSFPFWVGKMDNAWHKQPDVVGTSEHPPSYYLDRFSVDTVVFGEPALRLLVDTLGGDRVMLGSHYPYALGERPVANLSVMPDSLTSTPARSCSAATRPDFYAPEVVEPSELQWQARASARSALRRCAPAPPNAFRAGFDGRRVWLGQRRFQRRLSAVPGQAIVTV
ncbi:MAG: amidohydrolase family protein [Sciscionella sp.]